MIKKTRAIRCWRTWDSQLLHGELQPRGDGGQRVLHTVIEEEGVQRQAVRVDDGRYQVLRVMEERQRAHVPGERRTEYVSFTEKLVLLFTSPGRWEFQVETGLLTREKSAPLTPTLSNKFINTFLF